MAVIYGGDDQGSCQWAVVGCQKKQIPRGLKRARDDKSKTETVCGAAEAMP